MERDLLACLVSEAVGGCLCLQSSAAVIVSLVRDVESFPCFQMGQEVPGVVQDRGFVHRFC